MSSTNVCKLDNSFVTDSLFKNFKSVYVKPYTKLNQKKKLARREFIKQEKSFSSPVKSNSKNAKTKIEISYIKIKEINPSPYQPRKFFSKSSLKNLADSIKKYGILQPIVVRKINVDKYEIVFGERRFRACKLLNLMEIPAIIKNFNQCDCLFISIAENMHRNNLNYIEEAEGLKNIMLDNCLCVHDISYALNQSEEYILQKLYLLNLPKNIQSELLQNNLSEEYAIALLKLNDEQLQHEVIDKIIYYGLSVRTAENLIDRIISNTSKASGQSVNYLGDKSRINDLRIFFNTLKQAINVTKESGFDTDYNIDEVSGEIKISIKVNGNSF